MEELKASLKVFEEEYSLWDTASALLELGVTHAILGMPKEGLANSLRSIALFEELGDFRSQSEACFSAGITLNNCLLTREALHMLSKVMEIEDKMKIGDYLQLINANAFSALSLMMTAAVDQEKELAGERDEELVGYRKKALAHLLKALELCKKTDSLTAHAIVLSNLILQYTRLGDVKRAEECFEKLMKLPPEIRNQPRIPGTLAKAVFFAGKNEWEESNRYFKERFEELKTSPIPAGQWGARAQYAWSLERQGRQEEARVQLEESRKIRREAEEKFEYADVRANLMAPAIVRVGQTFEARLDIVNVSRGHGMLIRVENLLNPKLTVTRFPVGYAMRNDEILTGEEGLNPFQVKTIKLSLQAKQPEEVNLNPRVVYINDLGKTETCTANKVRITVQAPTSSTEEERIATLPQIEFRFKSSDAQKAFDFLIKAFLEDYVRKKLPIDRSGWRTLMEMVKNGKISKYGAYGFQGHGRHAISELEQRGLVEARVFSGERGRGGKILKLRVSYENEALRGRLVAKK